MQRDFKISLSQEFYSDVVYLSQYDSEYGIVFHVLDKYSKATDIDGYSAKFQGTRNDGLGFQYTSTASSDTVTFTIDTALTAVAGTHTGEIVFYDGNGLYYGSANVQIVVEPATHTESTIDADVTAQQTLKQELQEIVNTAATTVGANLGLLSDLTTTDKSSVVAAINEIDADVSTLNADLTVEINALNDALYDRSTDFTVNSGATTSHELWRSLHLKVGKYTLTCKQGSTLTSVTRNTFGYKKVGATGFIYESSASGYNLSSGKRSWTFSVTEEADYQIILWVNNPSATVTYSEISICGESEVEKTVGVIVDRMPLYTVPTYFESNISDAITAIKANMDSVGRHGDTFVFITDLHWGRTYSNTENSPSLIQRLTEELPINLVVCGGDLIDSGSKELMVGFMTDCMKAFTSFLHGNFLVARGNHDSNQDGISDPTQWITADEFYRIALKDADYSITEYANDGYSDYYKDNPSTKTRYVVIDTGYTENMAQEQLEWVQSVLDKSDDYKVLFFIHAVYENINGTGVWRGYTENLFPILDAHKSKVCGIFSGHTHTDESLSTPDGIPVIITDTDSLRVAASSPTGTANTATAGTDTEQCFDVVTIDYSAKTIKCVRIGRGQDRTFTY